jgi:hypothetical protein
MKNLEKTVDEQREKQSNSARLNEVAKTLRQAMPR